MQKKQGKATIVDVEIPDALVAYNTANKVLRARLVFSFVGTSSNDADDLTAALLSRSGNNHYSVIIDITDLSLKEAQMQFVGKMATFTVFSFTISELTDGKYSVVNNGEREYSSLSSPHIGEDNNDTAVFENLIKRLKRDISEGRLYLGELQQQPPTQQPQQGNNNVSF